MCMRRSMALLLCAVLAAPGCATTGTPRIGAATPAAQRADPAVLAEFVQTLPLGSAIRIEMAGGRVLKATLMKATAETLTVQLRTRIPEPPIEVPLRDVLRITPDGQGGATVAKMIGIGIAAGAAASVAVFMIIVALIDD